jgi:hypothetical protein
MSESNRSDVENFCENFRARFTHCCGGSGKSDFETVLAEFAVNDKDKIHVVFGAISQQYVRQLKRR